MVQWLRIHPPTQGTQVQSLVLEVSTCHRATKPMTKPLSQCSGAQVPQLWKPVLHSKRSRHDETSQHRNQRGASARHNQRKHSHEHLAQPKNIFKKTVQSNTHQAGNNAHILESGGRGSVGAGRRQRGFTWITEHSQNVSVTCVIKNNEIFKQSINMRLCSLKY